MKEIFLLACAPVSQGGGVGKYELSQKGKLKRIAFYPCDKPMYAVKGNGKLCVLLRQPFEGSDEGGYFELDEALTSASEILPTKGVCPCHLLVDGDKYFVNYLSGNIVKNGEKAVKREGFGVHKTRQTEAHTHYIGRMADGNLAVCDLGTDTLAIYDSALNLLSESHVPSGYGIRHLAISKRGTLYAVNELAPSVSVFTYQSGKAEYKATVKIDCKNPLANGAAIRLREERGKLYLSLREENELIVLSAERELKIIQRVGCGGNGPRDFEISDDFLIVCNEKSGTVAVFALKNGLIEEKTDEIELPQALCCVC